MKRLFVTITLALMLMVSANNKAEAQEVSFGFSGPGLGFNVLRGDYAEAIEDAADLNDADKIAFSFAPAFQVNLMFEFAPSFALETGIGFGYSAVSYTAPNSSLLEDGIEIYLKAGVSIPIMLRLQHESKRSVIYLSVGPKFIIPFLNDYAFRYLNLSALTDGTTILKNNDFGLDIGFAIGGEIRLLDANYIGLRVAYDLNVISIAKAPRGVDDFELLHDNFGVSLTYRYAFGSKWKNKE